MKMHVPIQNGVSLEDTLNRLLMAHLFGDMVTTKPDEYADAMLLGSGTLLASENLRRIRPDMPRIVFSSGYWKGIPEPFPHGSQFVAVRGESTCQFFGLDKSLAHGDAACLVSGMDFCIDLVGDEGVREEAVVVGVEQAGQMPSEDVFYDHANGDASNFILRLAQYRKITTSSYITAVVADALRIPWRPLVWDLRWHDYFGTLFGIEYSEKMDFLLTDENKLNEVQNNLVADVETIKEM